MSKEVALYRQNYQDLLHQRESSIEKYQSREVAQLRHDIQKALQMNQLLSDENRQLQQACEEL